MAIDSLLMDSSLISGHRYYATLQLRTPLAALLFDGTVSSGTTPPENPFDMAHGYWGVTMRTWRELGIDMDEMSMGSCASDVGQIDHDSYLRFLISVRMISGDTDRTIDERIAAVKSVLKMPEFSSYARKLGGQTAVIDKIFTKIISTIPGINSKVKESLWKARKRSVAAIRSMPESSLLSIDGVGPKSLAAIRAFCDSFQGDTLAERLES